MKNWEILIKKQDLLENNLTYIKMISYIWSLIHFIILSEDTGFRSDLIVLRFDLEGVGACITETFGFFISLKN